MSDVWKTTSCVASRLVKQGFSGVEEPGMLYNDSTATRETLLALPEREYDKQPIQREDVKWLTGSRIVRVVPMKSGNADGGKAATHHRSCQRNIDYTLG